MGLIEKGIDTLGKITNIVDQAVEDKDLANRLKYGFAETLVSSLFTGKGSSITKITLIVMYAIIIGAGLVCLFWQLLHPEVRALEAYKDYAIAVSPLVGSLTGIYGTMRRNGLP